MEDKLKEISSKLGQSKQNCKEEQKSSKKYKKYKNKDFERIRAENQ